MSDSIDGGRNIALVTVDSLQADRCRFMGYDEPTTPTLDATAADGFVVERTTASGPVAPASLPAIFIGTYPLAVDDGSPGEAFDLGGPFAVARSKSGDSLAARGRRMKIIDANHCGELYDLRGSDRTPVQNDDFEALCGAVVNKAREGGAEEARLNDTAEEVDGL